MLGQTHREFVSLAPLLQVFLRPALRFRAARISPSTRSSALSCLPFLPKVPLSIVVQPSVPATPCAFAGHPKTSHGAEASAKNHFMPANRLAAGVSTAIRE